MRCGISSLNDAPEIVISLLHCFGKTSEGNCLNKALMFDDGLTSVKINLRVTPAMEAGIADHVWTLEEIVNLC